MIISTDIPLRSSNPKNESSKTVNMMLSGQIETKEKDLTKDLSTFDL